MAISIDWSTKVINVPRLDLTLIQSSPKEIREMDVDWFRLELKNLEDSDEGMPYLDTHRHNTTVVLGGLTLARVVEIINGYTVTFEDGQYAVNLVGANNNVADVANVNQVSIRPSNSAGLIVVEGGELPSGIEDDIADAVWSRVMVGSITAAQLLQVIGAALAGKISGAGTSLVKIRDLEDTKDLISAAVDSNGNRLTVTIDL